MAAGAFPRAESDFICSSAALPAPRCSSEIVKPSQIFLDLMMLKPLEKLDNRLSSRNDSRLLPGSASFTIAISALEQRNPVPYSTSFGAANRGGGAATPVLPPPPPQMSQARAGSGRVPLGVGLAQGPAAAAPDSRAHFLANGDAGPSPRRGGGVAIETGFKQQDQDSSVRSHSWQPESKQQLFGQDPRSLRRQVPCAPPPRVGHASAGPQRPIPRRGASGGSSGSTPLSVTRGGTPAAVTRSARSQHAATTFEFGCQGSSPGQSQRQVQHQPVSYQQQQQLHQRSAPMPQQQQRHKFSNQGMVSPFSPSSANRGLDTSQGPEVTIAYDKPLVSTDSYQPSPSSASRERGRGVAGVPDRFTLVSEPVAEVTNPVTPRQTPWIDTLPDTRVPGCGSAYPRRSDKAAREVVAIGNNSTQRADSALQRLTSNDQMTNRTESHGQAPKSNSTFGALQDSCCCKNEDSQDEDDEEGVAEAEEASANSRQTTSNRFVCC